MKSQSAPISLLMLFSLIQGVCFAHSTEVDLSWGGFLEGQYAVDFNRPPQGERAFTTQPTHSGELGFNLGFIEARVESSQMRGRLALQAGTSVQSNYDGGVPSRGLRFGPGIGRHIQEARLGYRIADSTWIDAGVFLAHVGAETFVSRDNLNLTRSLVADFSPYFFSGVKLSHALDRLTLQLMIINGWQNVSENDSNKSVGTGIEYGFDRFSVAYNTIVGEESSPALSGSMRAAQFRHFHDFVLKSKGLEKWDWVGQIDLGFQKRSRETKVSHWQGATFQVRRSIGPSTKVSIRAEYFRDPDQIVLVTNRPDSFLAYGGSVGLDQAFGKDLVLRTECRHLEATSDVFPQHGGTFRSSNTVVTTSVSLGF